MTARAAARGPCFDPMAVVDSVVRLLVRERVAVSVGSVDQLVEDARRLLRDLGVVPAGLDANALYWMAVADECRAASAASVGPSC